MDGDEQNGNGGSRMIIGSDTFSQVKAHLSNQQLPGSPQSAGNTTAPPATQKPDGFTEKPRLTFSGTVAPPPPPPLEHDQIGPRIPENVVFHARPPPPPPPGFIPPQLRHRPPLGHFPPRPMPPPPPGLNQHRMLPGGPRHMMPPPPPPPSHMMARPSSMPPNPFQRPMAPPPLHMPPVRPMPPAPPQTFNFNLTRPSAMFSAPPQSTVPSNQPKVVYAAPPMINKRVTEAQKSTPSDTTLTAIATSAQPKENVTTVTEIGVTAVGPAVMKPQHVASGIELNIPVEKIEAEKKSTIGTSQPVSMTTAAPEVREQPSAQHSSKKEKKKEKKRKFVRMAAGTTWEDQTLGDWDLDDFRLFCGDLGNEVTDDTLTRAFNKYPSFQKAKVVRDKKSNKTKGFGFVSFKDPNDFTRAMREMNGKYVGNRPIKLRKSQWRDRQIDNVKKKDREKKRLGFR